MAVQHTPLPLTASLCQCGCKKYRLNIGSPGFTKEQSNLIVDAVNNTAGQGINPNAVPFMLEAIENAISLLNPVDDYEALQHLNYAVKKAELK